VGLVSSAVAVVLGTMAALALDRYRFPGKGAVRFFVVLPITLPGIVTGIAMLSFFSLSDRPLSSWSSEIGGGASPGR
jgi:ABC-type spermidine/putrescine transport system permease subunit II